MATTIFDVAISLFKNAESPTHPEDITIAEVLKRIQRGRWKKAVLELRDLLRQGHQEKYQNRKKFLPAATFQGQFSYRSTHGFLTASCFLVCDGDHLGDRLPALCTAMRSDPLIAFCFLSPSGDGIKFGFRVPTWTTEAEYKFLFQQLDTYTAKTYQIQPDRARSDVAGLCFVSYDPDCYHNPDAQEFPIDWDAWHAEQERIRQEAAAAQKALNDARAKLTAARHAPDQKELRGFEKWKAHALDYDIQWIENRLREAAPGDPVQGRHQAYLSAGLRIGSMIAPTGYAHGMTDATTLVNMVKSIRSDFRPKADDRAVLEMIPFGMEKPKTDADLWQGWEEWKTKHPLPSNGNGNGTAHAEPPQHTDADMPPSPPTEQPAPATTAKAMYKEVRKQAVALWKSERFAEGVTCFVQHWDTVQEMVTKPQLVALLATYLPKDQDAAALVKQTFTTPVEAIPGEGKGGMADAIRDALEQSGFQFAYNELKDAVYVNGAQVDDPGMSIIYYPMLNLGFQNKSMIETVMLAMAQKRRTHTIKDYLTGLTWDGQDRFTALSAYFSDKDGVFPLYVRKYMVGSIGKVFQHKQNPMLVFMGSQGLGKGYFCRWICPIPEVFVSCAIMPDSKDHQLRACDRWIWEAEEFGATARRADREALKAFLTNDKFTVRRPYGHFDTDKYASASFIGTINDDGTGVLDDVTGNRRYRPVYLTRVDRAYSTKIDIHQLWAQAYHLYVHGETSDLFEADEKNLRDEILPKYKRENPMEDLMIEYFLPDDTFLLSSTEILTILFELGYKGKYTKADAMDLANVMKTLDIKKDHTRDKRGYRCRYLGESKTTMPAVSATLPQDNTPFYPDQYAAIIQ